MQKTVEYRAEYRSEKEKDIAKLAHGAPKVDQDYFSGGKFDNKKFTEDFLKNQKENLLLQKIKEEETIARLKENEYVPKLLDFTIYDHLLGIKNTFFRFINDAVSFNLSKETILKDHGLFYSGLLALIIVVIYSLLISLK